MNAIQEIEQGFTDGELGAELIKKRIVRIGEGKEAATGQLLHIVPGLYRCFYADFLKT